MVWTARRVVNDKPATLSDSAAPPGNGFYSRQLMTHQGLLKVNGALLLDGRQVFWSDPEL